jgi:diguanylate cyclase (GGDEF)-like protein
MEKQSAQVKKIKRSLGRRLTLLIIFMIVAISGAMMIIGYFRLKTLTEQYYFKMGETTASVVALLIDADSLSRYGETLTQDKEYDDTMQLLRKARSYCGAQTLYVFQVGKEGVTYIYDTDTSDMWCELGYLDPYVYEKEDGTSGDLYPEATKQQLLRGGKVDTIMGVTQYGWTITVDKPLYGSDGSCKGYVGIDFDVNQVITERMEYFRNLIIIILLTTTVFAAIYLHIIRKYIIRPINIMVDAADNFIVNSLESGGSVGESEILSMKINTGDELQSLSEALKSMVRKIHEYLVNLKLITIKSETDVLTSLCNRGAFEQRVSAILRLRPEEDQINAFIMIDVDYFKAVNDTYGHAAGDMVLTECANALLRVTREADVVGRLGGDEFAVFCKSVGSVAIAEDKARQIRNEWLKIIPPGGEKGVTASIGISFAPQDGTVYQELFNKADEVLYKVKEAGRDGFGTSQTP